MLNSNLYKKNKKGLVELTSFALLTLLILVLSLTAYLVISSILEDQLANYERNIINSQLKKLNIELTQIENLQDSSFTTPLTLQKGVITINKTAITYNSLIEFTSSEKTCFEQLCYNSKNGFETISLDLSNNFTFKQSITLKPENYIITFTNIGGNEIDFKFK